MFIVEKVKSKDMNKQLISGIIILVIGTVMHYLLEGGDYTFFSGVVVGLGVGLILVNLWIKIKSSGQNNDG